MSEYNFKTKPYAHQLEALKQSYNKEYYAFFMEMGTGKSKVLIDEIGGYFLQGKIDSALIIAPKGVYRNWERGEIPTHLPNEIPYTIAAWRAPSEMTKDDKKKLKDIIYPNGKLRILLMNIEALSGSVGIKYVTQFLHKNRTLLAIDESTTIKTPTASRTKNAIKISKLAKIRRIMTGSPVTKNPLDVYAQLEFLSPNITRQNYWAFKSRYAVMVRRNFGTRSTNLVVGFQRLPELNTIIDQYSYRVLKEDCLDLPEKIYTTRSISLTSEQVKAYEEMRRFNITEMDGKTMTSLSTLAALIRLHQITCGHVTFDDGDTKEIKSNRMNELLNVLEEVDGKVIIWANYRFDIKKIQQTLSEKFGSDSVATYFGDTKDKDRQDIVEKFQDKNSSLKYFVGNPSTGGYGLTLTAAHTVVYYSNSYDLEKRMQSEDRAHRIGQVNKVTYVDMIAEGTVDEKIVRSLRSKIDIASEVMGEDVKNWVIEPIKKRKES
jgi:SNF2 family DNA or RNA helicase